MFNATVASAPGATVTSALAAEAPAEIRLQLEDNLRWIEAADATRLVVGSQARILYADAEGRMQIAAAFNDYWNNMAMSSVMSGSERCIMAPANNLRLRYCDTGMNIQYGSHNLIINFGENRILVAESGEKSQV